MFINLAFLTRFPLQQKVLAAYLNNLVESCCLQPSTIYMAAVENLEGPATIYYFSVSQPLWCQKSSCNNNWHLFQFGEILGSGSGGVVRDVDAVTKYEATTRKFYQKNKHRVIKVATGDRAGSLLQREVSFLRWLAIFDPKDVMTTRATHFSCISYLVMNHFAGETLQAILLDEQTGAKVLTLQERIFLSWELIQALKQIDAAGILHLDINPCNILCRRVNDRLRVQIIDFGVARMSGDYQSKLYDSTEFFMAPEYCNGVLTELTGAADVFSLGLVLAMVWHAQALIDADFNMLKKIRLHLRRYGYEDLFTGCDVTGMRQEECSTLKELLLAAAEPDPVQRISLDKLERFFCN